jgi:CoA:oxalate CoA-transferase
LGAEVIKIERPGGDPARTVGPHVDDESLYFASINRNKKSFTVDLTKPEGKETFKNLIRDADVFIENLKPGSMKRLGFSDEIIGGLNPRLIHASISGFGQTGPLSDRPAFDIIVQAMSGMMSVTGPLGGPPVRVGVSVGDIAAALFATIDIVASLLSRERGGARRRVDISMLDCQLALLENAIARHLNAGVMPEPLGSRHPSIAPFETYSTSDGRIAVASDGEQAWQRFCHALDLHHLTGDRRFSDNNARVNNRDALEKILNERFATAPTGMWLDRLRAAQVPAAAVNDISTALAEPQVEARQMISKIRTRTGRELKFVACPIGKRGADQPPPALNN